MADGEPEASQGSWDRRPIPDPTFLTTEQLLREAAALRRELELQLQARREITDEKFASVETQFALIERQRVEQKADTTAAVAAALAAAKEAVKEQTTASEARTDKSEASMEKRVDQQAVTTELAIKGLTNILNDLKDRDLTDLKARIQAVESLKQGAEQQRTATDRTFDKGTAVIASVVGLILVVLAVGGFIIANLPPNASP